MKTRLDLELVHRGLARSRESAQRLIMAGRVRINSRPAAKPDLRVQPDTPIEVMAGRPEYASRGALKLIHALDYFAIPVAGRLALDVGASNGGFTDVLLRRAAAGVIALDVGYGQLDVRLRADPRVVVMDRTNVRSVEPADLPFRPCLAVVDVSFISLRLVLPVVAKLIEGPGEIIALVKPQFEAGKGRVGRGGVVRDDAVRREAVEGIDRFARGISLEVVGTVESPIRGAAGNREYLMFMRSPGDGE